jgi:large subunit ribosomal protein L10
MKSRNQKQEELNKGRKMLEGSQAVLLLDFSRVKTADLRRLRQELKKSGNPLLVIKKRLLGLLFKERGWELPLGEVKVPVGAVFASNLEEAAGLTYRFFFNLEKDKKVKEGKLKLLGGYNLVRGEPISAEQAVFIGQLPPREALLAQLLGMLAAPIRSFLYVLSEKAKRSY